MTDIVRDSARSDKFTGGRIEKAPLAAGAGGLKITINVPSFQMTLWQDGKEVRTYPIGVGMLEYPIVDQPRQGVFDRMESGLDPALERLDRSVQHSQAGRDHPADRPAKSARKSKDPARLRLPAAPGERPGRHGQSCLARLRSRACRSDLYDLAEKIVAGARTRRDAGTDRRGETHQKNPDRADRAGPAGRDHLRHNGGREADVCTFIRTFTSTRKTRSRTCVRNFDRTVWTIRVLRMRSLRTMIAAAKGKNSSSSTRRRHRSRQMLCG